MNRRRMLRAATGLAALSFVTVLACRDGGSKSVLPANSTDATAASAPPVLIDDAVSNHLLAPDAVWTTDFSWSGPHRIIRALVPLSHSYYHIDRKTQSGLAFDALSALASLVRSHASKLGAVPEIVVIPTRRDRLMPALEEGRGDIVLAGIGVTARRGEQAVLSLPTNTGIRDVVVTSQSAPPLTTIEDLSGTVVHVRRSSSEYEALSKLSARLATVGRAPIRIVDTDELLEDEDLVQLADAGIIPITVVKDYVAILVAPIYDRAVIRTDLVVQDNVSTVIAIRKDAPLLHQLIDDFVSSHSAGSTQFGDRLIAGHIGDVVRLNNPTSETPLKRFRSAMPRLREAGASSRIEWPLIAAQLYQESELDPARSDVEAAALKLRATIDRYFQDADVDPLNQTLFALASSDAGPEAIADLRVRTKAAGLDPHLWFYNVEILAAHRLGRKTVEYVSNIYKYYTVYKALDR